MSVCRPSQERPQSGGKFARFHWLDHIVIGSAVKARFFINGFGLTGKNENRSRSAVRTKCSYHLDAAQSRKTPVNYQDLIDVLSQQFKSDLTILRNINYMQVRFQDIRQLIGESPIVLD